MAKHKKRKQQQNGSERPPIEQSVAQPIIDSLIHEAETESPEVQHWYEKYVETLQALEAAGGTGENLSMLIWQGIDAHCQHVFRRALELRQDPAELLNIRDTSA